MKNVFKLLVISLISTAVTCEQQENENCHTSIRFSNNTEKDLIVMHRHLSFHFTDPFNIVRLGFNVKDEWHRVNRGEQNNRRAMSTFGRVCIEHVFEDNKNWGDTVFIYIFDATVVENTPWEVVARDNLILKRYHLTLEDLQRLNWIVSYPPEEEMRDIKQYPPFGQ